MTTNLSSSSRRRTRPNRVSTTTLVRYILGGGHGRPPSLVRVPRTPFDPVRVLPSTRNGGPLTRDSAGKRGCYHIPYQPYHATPRHATVGAAHTEPKTAPPTKLNYRSVDALGVMLPALSLFFFGSFININDINDINTDTDNKLRSPCQTIVA